ncbi:MAG: response regulator, partial [Firmicutes bacterium]|nr:response regulator [Bacillota bacterium]
MCRIAICDDETIWLKQAVSLIEEYGREKGKVLEVSTFGCAKSFLEREEGQQTFDIYLIDIYMPEMTGMELSEHLRKKGIQMPIIFLTSSVDHALDAYNVNATHYLVKPYTKERFFDAMDRAVQSIPEEPYEKVVFKVSGIYHSIDIQQIMFSETDGNYQDIFLENSESVRVRMTAVDLYSTLKQWPQFYPCGR